MKYLKLFENLKSLNKYEIQEFVESHLAYLLDDDFFIDTDFKNLDYISSIVIRKRYFYTRV